jgi:hypothetical protein
MTAAEISTAPCSDDADDAGDFHSRVWWVFESRRAGSDWAAVIALHLDIVDRLRGRSS